jgi:ATP-dependent Clp protease ATP-binding subunit ClpA
MFERFTERARKVVVLAQEEARHFNHNYIGTEHILLGLVRENEGVASQMLSGMGVETDGVREQVIRMLGDRQPERRRGLGARLLGGSRVARPEPVSRFERAALIGRRRARRRSWWSSITCTRRRRQWTPSRRP